MKAALLLYVVAALALAGVATAAPARTPGPERLQVRLERQQHALAHARHVVRWFETRRFRLVAGERPARGTAAYEFWWHRQQQVWLVREIRDTRRLILAARPPHYDQWVCIHGYEGSWTDPNSPYWGGLQMDRGFQETYGAELLAAKGTADHWTPLEQMMVAERAYEGYNGYAGRGFWPWPTTARRCGLL